MVDRVEMMRKLKRLGVRGRLGRFLEVIYTRTVNQVQWSGGLTRAFKSTRGVRQGGPLSPLLFNLYIADLEMWLKGNQVGGVVIGSCKIYMLAYADDMVLVAETPEEMQGMLGSMEKYLTRWKLVLNASKSKILIFKKGGRRAKKEKWNWIGKEVDVVKSYKYLGFWMQPDNGFSVHVKYVKKKARAAMGAIWGIGESNIKGDWKLRCKLYKAVIEAILMYRVEIWGWEEQEDLQGLETKYWKWLLNLNWNTPQYIVQEEVRAEGLWEKAWWRAYRYKRDLRGQDRSTWAQECARWRADVKQKDIRWRVRKRCELVKIGLSEYGLAEIELWGVDVRGEIGRRMKDRRAQENWRRIEESRYNRVYKEIKKNRTGRAEYLNAEWIPVKEKIRMGRYRVGNEVKAAEYWKDEGERKCRMCGVDIETLVHIVEECGGWESEDRTGCEDAVK